MEELVSFIIPTYNNETTLRTCLESIIKQGVKKEIIAVDGGSTDRTRDIIGEYDVKLIIERKRGIGIARNRGSDLAGGNYVAFVDADAVLSDNWAEKALGTMKAGEQNVAGVAGPVFSVKKNAIGRALDSLSPGMPGKGERYYVKALNTTGVLFKMNVFRKFRFDETFMRGEDTEIGFRISGKGYKLLFDTKLIVYHHHPTTIKELVKKWFEFGKSFPLSYQKHRARRDASLYIRLLYIPILCLLIVSSLLWRYYVWFACLQLLALFSFYIFIGLKIPHEKRKVDIPTFAFIHSFKQFAKVTGIWYGFFKRAFEGTDR